LQLYAFETSFEEIVEGTSEATEERKEGEPRVRHHFSLISQFSEGDELRKMMRCTVLEMKKGGKRWKCLGLELMDLVEVVEEEEGEEGMMIGEEEEDDTRD